MSEDIKKPLQEAVADVKQTVKETAAEVTNEIVDEIKESKQEVKEEAANWFRQLPNYGKILFVVAVLVGYAVYQKYTTVPVVVNVQQPVATDTVKETVVDKEAVQRADAGRLLAKVLRNQAVKRLQSEGFKSVDGVDKPLSKSDAVAVVANLDDEELLAVAQGGLPQGKLFDTVLSVLQWLIDHKDQIAKIVDLILMLLSAFV